MAENKTKPTDVSIESFLETVSPKRQEEAKVLIAMMQDISGYPAVLWGPSIIGFGSQHYRYESGREGDMPCLAFSPRKAALTIYLKVFKDCEDLLSRLGKHKSRGSCLYINKLTDIDLPILRDMLEHSYRHRVEK
jgi:hypothetical protein